MSAVTSECCTKIQTHFKETMHLSTLHIPEQGKNGIFSSQTLLTRSDSQKKTHLFGSFPLTNTFSVVLVRISTLNSNQVTNQDILFG